MKKRRKIRMPVTKKRISKSRWGKKTEDEFFFLDKLGERRTKKPWDTRSHLLIFVEIKWFYIRIDSYFLSFFYCFYVITQQHYLIMYVIVKGKKIYTLKTNYKNDK